MPPPVNGGSPELAAPQRNNFFYGKLMDVGEWQKDQRHFDFKRSLLNRMTMGSGVVCGLGLVAAADDEIQLLPGLALDGWGREIVVPAGLAFDPSQPTDDAGHPVGEPLASGSVEVRLAYAESGVDPVPIVAPDCDNAGPCAPSTVRETFRVIVRGAGADPPPAASCGFGDFPLDDPLALQKQILARIGDPCSAGPADPSVVLGRISLDDGAIDTVAGRQPVYTNAVLFELILCLAGRVAPLEP